MPRFNRNYPSLFNKLVSLRLQPFIWLNKHFYAEVPVRYPREYPLILGALQPIVDMGKDLVDTFKPYKSGYHVRRDLLQPLRGLGNIAKGLATLVCMPLFLLFDTVKFMFTAYSFMSYLRLMKSNLHEKTSWLVEGVLTLARGVTQIAATPLTWFMKMPLRALITAIKGAPKIEQNRGIRRLVAEADDFIKKEEASETQKGLSEDELEQIHDELALIRYDLMRRFNKAIKNGQKTEVPVEKHRSKLARSMGYTGVRPIMFFESQHPDDLKACIALFRR